ncbi:hypothetical protein QR680_005292 [Steinernema hermaphroditum]|uniref:Protein kinase domain-containing protein n=1 Tax=Steinernema hermaphroditum TaxID=289476 RepID=A0AA39HSQ2_9BILA|nr:hypothetical protein QR680_005292 [Steinernema hermaphroditum]
MSKPPTISDLRAKLDDMMTRFTQASVSVSNAGASSAVGGPSTAVVSSSSSNGGSSNTNGSLSTTIGGSISTNGSQSTTAHSVPDQKQVEQPSKIGIAVSMKRTVYSTANTSIACRQKRTVTVSDVTYEVLGTLGHGGSSKVYHVVNEMGRVFAIKTVDLSDADEFTRRSYINEIGLLSKLQGSPHIITLYAYELQGDNLHVVMEKGDGDLQAYLRNRRSDEQNVKSYTMKFLWGEMLRCVKVIHDKNIVHSDLKPANFLFVGGGHIKLIDFGIASSIPSDQTSVLKEGMMGTLSYMSPEAIKECGNANTTDDFDDDSPKSRYKVPLKSDVWSLGCILYNMVYARTPFQGIKTMQEKMAAIVNPNFVIDFPDIDDKRLLDVMKKCLVRDVNRRASVDELLHHPYLEDKQGENNVGADMDQILSILQSNDMTPRTKTNPIRSSKGFSGGLRLPDERYRRNIVSFAADGRHLKMLLKTFSSSWGVTFLFIFPFFVATAASKSRCYSCASASLQSNFLTINRGPAVRKENPKVFDNFCNGDTWIIREKSLVDCDGPCFKWQQILNNTGVHSMLTIRGCYSKMFDLTVDRTPKVPANAFCSETRASLECLSDANVIEHTCWCDSDACNPAPGRLALSSFCSIVLFVLLFLK